MEDILRVVFARREGVSTTNALLSGQKGVIGAIGSLRQFEAERAEREKKESAQNLANTAQSRLSSVEKVVDSAVSIWAGVSPDAATFADKKKEFTEALKKTGDDKPDQLILRKSTEDPTHGIPGFYVPNLQKLADRTDMEIRLQLKLQPGDALDDDMRKTGFKMLPDPGADPAKAPQTAQPAPAAGTTTTPTAAAQPGATVAQPTAAAAPVAAPASPAAQPAAPASPAAQPAAGTSSGLPQLSPPQSFLTEFARAWQDIGKPATTEIDDDAVTWARNMGRILLLAQSKHGEEVAKKTSGVDPDFMTWLEATLR